MKLLASEFLFDFPWFPSQEPKQSKLYQISKDRKQTTLTEIANFIDAGPPNTFWTDEIVQLLLRCVKKNLDGADTPLPPPPPRCVPDFPLPDYLLSAVASDAKPWWRFQLTVVDVAVPQWPHLRLVYDMLMAVLANSEGRKVFDRVVTQDDINTLFRRLSSPDIREREFVQKELLGFITQTSLARAGQMIQTTVVNTLLQFSRGVSVSRASDFEAGTVITSVLDLAILLIRQGCWGFFPGAPTCQSIQFTTRVLMPLFSCPSRCLSQFQVNLYKTLNNCIFLQPRLYCNIIGVLVATWPKSCSWKQNTFLNQLNGLHLVLETYNRTNQKNPFGSFFQVKSVLLYLLVKHLNDLNYSVQKTGLQLVNSSNQLVLRLFLGTHSCCSTNSRLSTDELALLLSSLQLLEKNSAFLEQEPDTVLLQAVQANIAAICKECPSISEKFVAPGPWLASKPSRVEDWANKTKSLGVSTTLTPVREVRGSGSAADEDEQEEHGDSFSELQPTEIQKMSSLGITLEAKIDPTSEEMPSLSMTTGPLQVTRSRSENFSSKDRLDQHKQQLGQIASSFLPNAQIKEETNAGFSDPDTADLIQFRRLARQNSYEEMQKQMEAWQAQDEQDAAGDDESDSDESSDDPEPESLYESAILHRPAENKEQE